MGTLVCFHAHPDDECIQTGGVMARASAEGHRVVLVVATKGEHGEVADGFLADEEALWQRRVAETYASADILGAHRVEFLGYHDSGMMGTPTNDETTSFWQAEVDEAAERLATILREEAADVLTGYDEIGGYGHPDHIQVHRVARRAAELVPTTRLFEATMNRDHLFRLMRERPEIAAEMEFEPPEIDEETFGMPEARIAATVDVRPWVDTKRRAMQAHASQIAEQSFFLAMPPPAFEAVFGQEWFLREGASPGSLDWLF
jgi:LmbE family N-acetylglucosaminyl deacetylase